MIDKQSELPKDNIRSLLHYVGEGLDSRLTSYRKGTRYENVRPSDVRVFMLAYRSPQSISELSRKLQISRQAVHASVHRLQDLKVVDLVAVEGDKRERMVRVTDRGQTAQQAAREQIVRFEAEIADVIGHNGLETFRGMLVQLAERFSSAKA